MLCFHKTVHIVHVKLRDILLVGISFLIQFLDQSLRIKRRAPNQTKDLIQMMRIPKIAQIGPRAFSDPIHFIQLRRFASRSFCVVRSDLSTIREQIFPSNRTQLPLGTLSSPIKMAQVSTTDSIDKLRQTLSSTFASTTAAAVIVLVVVVQYLSAQV